ncbi:MAG: hypothetical protein VX916_01110 [Planctomycetota bacterium]|nr:hypothetical protein [Planctomycetota bacterium]
MAMCAPLTGATTEPPRSPSDDISFQESVVIPADRDSLLALRDLDGDQRLELLEIASSGISCRDLSPDRTYPATTEDLRPWPDQRTAWDLADIEGNGEDSVLLLIDGQEIWQLLSNEEGRLQHHRVLLTDAGGYLPTGIRRVRMARDVNDDGRADLIVPGTDRYRIFLASSGPGGASIFDTPPLEIHFQPTITLELGDPERLDANFGLAVDIPWFQIADINGDGLSDLQSETDDRVDIYLAGPDLPKTPSWSLDLEALRQETAGEESSINLDNLFQFMESQVVWRVTDLDGTPPNDLVLQQGGMFRIYLGGSQGFSVDNPDRVLKASGNVLYFFLRDTDGDDVVDLQIVKTERVSLGRALSLLVIAGSFDLDIFTYRNEGGIVAKRPSDRKTLTVKIPALISFAEEAEALLALVQERHAVPTEKGDMDGDGSTDDVIDLDAGVLSVVFDGVPDDLVPDYLQEVASVQDIDSILEKMILADLDRQAEGAVRTLNLRDAEDLLVFPGWSLREANKAHPAHSRWPAGEDRLRDQMGTLLKGEDIELLIQDVDGNGISDIVVIESRLNNQRRVRFFVSETPPQ